MATVPTEDCIEALQRFLESRGKSPLTIKSYVSDVRVFFTDLRRDEIDTDNLDYNAAVWLNRYKKLQPPKTTLRRITSIRNLGKCLGISLLADYQPPKAQPQKPHPLPGGREDLEKLLRLSDTNDKKILVTLCGYCGLRVGEALSISPQHFNIHSRSIKFIGKGGKEREVMLSPRAWSILQPFVLEAMIMGQYSPLVRLSDRMARYTITRLGRVANIRREISSHDLRATFATEAYRKTRDIRAVQILLGHSSPTQTQIYIGSTDDEQRDAASFAEDWDDDPEEDGYL